MERDQIVREMPPVTDACAPDLRVVLEAWKVGKATGADLIEASRRAMLACLKDYERKPLPTVPEEIAYYRHMSKSARQQADQKVAIEVFRRHADFIQSEAYIKTLNRDHRALLTELLAWAHERQLPASICARIREALVTHEDLEDQIW